MNCTNKEHFQCLIRQKESYVCTNYECSVDQFRLVRRRRIRQYSCISTRCSVAPCDSTRFSVCSSSTARTIREELLSFNLYGSIHTGIPVGSLLESRNHPIIRVKPTIIDANNTPPFRQNTHRFLILLFSLSFAACLEK